MDEKILNFLSKCFLFSGIEFDSLKAISASFEYKIADFERGETIFSPSSYSKMIGFVYEGECQVERVRLDDETVPLNTMKKYTSFGILSIFSEPAEYPTKIWAKTKSRIIFIDKDTMLTLVSQNPTVAMNVIVFLCAKISFLNNKIATFSEKNTLSKLCSYLLSESDKSNGIIPYSATKISAAIGIGRASLYRDLATLESENIIKTENKKIYIISPSGLERNKK